MKQGQKISFFKHIRSKGGQAVIEYILLAVVIVGMIMGASKVFKSVNNGMQKYIGDYVICLMEYGELPTLGVTTADLKKHTSGQGRTCDSKFASFTIEDGRPPTEGSGGSSATARGRGAGNSNSSSDESEGAGGKGSSKADKNSDGGEGENELADGSGNSRSRGNSSSSAARNSIRKKGTTYGTLDSGGGDNQVKIIESDDSNSGSDEAKKRRKPRVTARADKPPVYKAVSSRMAQEIAKNQKNKPKPKKPVTMRALAADEVGAGPQRKMLAAKVYEPPAQKEDKEDVFAFGNILRWLIIAGVIIAICIFFGGQLLNYSNSDS